MSECTAPPVTLTEFLLARIADDEAWAQREERINHWHEPMTTERVLRECEAKRRIIKLAATHAALCPPDDWPDSGGMESAALADLARWQLRVLATIYADHPDYRDEWRP